MKATIDNDLVTAALKALRDPGLKAAKEKVALADVAKKFLMETLANERGIDWDNMAAGKFVELNNVLRFKAVPKKRFNQGAFMLRYPELAKEFSKEKVEIHTENV